MSPLKWTTSQTSLPHGWTLLYMSVSHWYQGMRNQLTQGLRVPDPWSAVVEPLDTAGCPSGWLAQSHRICCLHIDHTRLSSSLTYGSCICPPTPPRYQLQRPHNAVFNHSYLTDMHTPSNSRKLKPYKRENPNMCLRLATNPQPSLPASFQVNDLSPTELCLLENVLSDTQMELWLQLKPVEYWIQPVHLIWGYT